MTLFWFIWAAPQSLSVFFSDFCILKQIYFWKQRHYGYRLMWQPIFMWINGDHKNCVRHKHMHAVELLPASTALAFWFLLWGVAAAQTTNAPCKRAAIKAKCVLIAIEMLPQCFNCLPVPYANCCKFLHCHIVAFYLYFFCYSLWNFQQSVDVQINFIA